jgi:hypothetical protein
MIFFYGTARSPLHCVLKQSFDTIKLFLNYSFKIVFSFISVRLVKSSHQNVLPRRVGTFLLYLFGILLE